MSLRAQARVNLAAVERNVHRVRTAAGGALLAAVVKADGYGHGAVPIARAALSSGATWLAVATAGEAAELRAGGIGAPILVMGALSAEELPLALEARAAVVAWDERFVEAAVNLAADRGGPPARIHVKLDSGMGRLGTREVAEARRVADAVLAAGPAAELDGVMTHFATADEDPEFMAHQLQRFLPFVAETKARHPEVLAHAANSAATLTAPETHLDLVRCGIALYGLDPMNEHAGRFGLEPAMALRSYVAAVKLARPGDSAGYGRRFIAEEPTWIATVPMGYGDGVRRGLTNRGHVLIGGRRRELVGTVSMDNITVRLAGAGDATVGDEVIVLGGEGEERVSAEELAEMLGTINYEIVCGISSRVPRHYHRDEPA